MRDNYARNIFVALMLMLVLSAFLIGIISGFIIVKVEQSVTDSHLANLMLIYDVK